jgi:hypothetical protein
MASDPQPRPDTGNENAATAARPTEDEAGGMIELVAANVNRFDSRRDNSGAPARTHRGRLRSTGERIQVDGGVGLYQAFELAFHVADGNGRDEGVAERSEPASPQRRPDDEFREPARESDDAPPEPTLPKTLLSAAVLVAGAAIQARATGERTRPWTVATL